MRKTIFIAALFSLLLQSCKSKNYIKYYSRVYTADSIMRFRHDTIASLKRFDRIFRRFDPRNDERVKEFERYIFLSEKYQRDFGGKKNVLKLIHLNAVSWTFTAPPASFFNLSRKYGVYEASYKYEIRKWKNGQNKALVDSFRIAFARDQDGRPTNRPLVEKNVNKNARLLNWTLDHYGFPTDSKIGWFPRPTFLSHMIESDLYPLFKQKIFKYVKSGDCNPRDYGMMMDYGLKLTEGSNKTIYGLNGIDITDSATVNKNRKKIGLPSLKQAAAIRKEFFENEKKNSGT